jgi:2-methylisocitrate lyase-like PEP mutase family enzyme
MSAPPEAKRHARADGRHALSLKEHLAKADLLIRVTGLPVNDDFEDGLGPEPTDVADTVQAAIRVGLAGLGIEDTTADPEQPIHDFDKAVARMKAAEKVAKGARPSSRLRKHASSSKAERPTNSFTRPTIQYYRTLRKHHRLHTR